MKISDKGGRSYGQPFDSSMFGLHPPPPLAISTCSASLWARSFIPPTVLRRTSIFFVTSSVSLLYSSAPSLISPLLFTTFKLASMS